MFSLFKRKKNDPKTPTPSHSEKASSDVLSTENLSSDGRTTAADVNADSPNTAPTPTPRPDPKPQTEATAKANHSPPQAQANTAAGAVFFEEASEQPADVEVVEKKGFFRRLASGLSKTRAGFSDGVANLLLGKKEIDDDLLEDLETQLVMADVGVEATEEIMGRLTERVGRKELTDSDALFEALIEELQGMLSVCQQPLIIDAQKKPYVILMVGVNGVGKTTTIGKLAKQFQAKGKSVMLAAGDTFRAAAVEQLQIWGERNDVPVIAQHTGADSASVLFDALQAATARGSDILIADTAGRLHTKDNLMNELEKVVRVMKKIDPSAPHEVMLVLDAGTGQNALNQARQFQQCVGVSGLTLTKLDGTAKGGVIFALAKQLSLPVRFIGVGEGIDDLRPFDAEDFTRALFDSD